MVWVLRACLGLLVFAYAAWLGLPLAQGLTSGVTVIQTWTALVPGSGLGGSALAGLMLGMVVLYALSGLATAAGLSWAPALYFGGYLSEIGLRLAVATERQPVPATLDIATRIEGLLRPLGLMVEATPLMMGALLAVGLCILATGVWRGQKGAALTRVWTQAPVWA